MREVLASGWFSGQSGLRVRPSGKPPVAFDPLRTLGAPWFRFPKPFVSIKFRGNPSANGGRGEL
jgi:hypothetical protein